MSENLAVYLNLPEYFHDAGEKLREHYYFNLKLIQMLENTPNVKNRLIEHISLVLARIDDYGIHVKELLIIYIRCTPSSPKRQLCGALHTTWSAPDRGAPHHRIDCKCIDCPAPTHSEHTRVDLEGPTACVHLDELR